MTSRAVINAPKKLLPKPFAAWFLKKGWTPRPHQVELLAKNSRRPLDPADRANRRRQDAGRLPAEPRRPLRAATDVACRGQGHPHPLHLAAEGARRRHRPQPRAAGRRDRPQGAHGNPHRRHLGLQAPAPEAEAAGYIADDAGAGSLVAVGAGCRPFLRRPRHRHPRRAARAGHLQARRPFGARSRAPPRAGAGP